MERGREIMKTKEIKKTEKVQTWTPKNVTDDEGFVIEPKIESQKSFIGRENRKELLIGQGGRNIRMNVKDGFWIGGVTFNEAPFSVNLAGQINAKSLTIDSFVTCSDTSIAYTGTWALQTVVVAMNSQRKQSSTVGDYFEITFSSPAIGLICEKAEDQGKIKIYLDNVYLATVDLYSTTVFVRSLVWQKTDISFGQHVLKVEVETKNGSSLGNYVDFEGYTLTPSVGITLEALSMDLISFNQTVTTDAQGYVLAAVTALSGYSYYEIVGVRLSNARMTHVLADTTTGWDVTNPAGITFRYTYNGTGTAPGLAFFTAGVSTISVAGGFAAGNQGAFTVTAVAATYFEVSNAAGVVESGITGTTIINTNLVNGKVCWRTSEIYVYDGQPSASHALGVTVLASKL
jgi:hypothetical protein